MKSQEKNFVVNEFNWDEIDVRCHGISARSFCLAISCLALGWLCGTPTSGPHSQWFFWSPGPPHIGPYSQ